jgi:hypothetical protein
METVLWGLTYDSCLVYLDRLAPYCGTARDERS